MSTRKILIVAFVIAILLIPAYNYDVKKVEAQSSVSVTVISKYPAPHNTTFWLHSNAPIYYDAVNVTPVFDRDTGYIVVKSLGGFSGSISFSLDTPFGWPAELVVDLPPSTTLAAGETKTLTFNITHAEFLAASTYAFRVKVTSGAQVFYSNFANVRLVGHAVLFRLKGFPYEITTAAGTTLTVPVLAISRSGYVGTVALSRVLPSGWPSQPAGFSVSLDAPDPLYTGGLLKSHGVFEAKVKIAVASTVTPSLYHPYVVTYISDYIFNGDFSPALTKVVGGKLYPLGWNFTSNVELDAGTYFTGPYSAKLVAPTVDYTGNVWLRQKIWLPPTSPSYLFTFRYNIPTTSDPDDRVWFRIYNTTYYKLFEVLIPSGNYTGDWRSYSRDLATVPSVMAYRGKEIIISFELIHDGDFNPTTVFIDYIRFPFEDPMGFNTINRANSLGSLSLPVKIVDMAVVRTSPAVSDLSMITGSFKVAGQIIPNGYYGGNVYLSASISPAIPFTSTLSVTGPVNWLYNGDFESGNLTNWVVLSDVFGSVSVVSDPNVISGNYSARFLYDSTSSNSSVTGYTSLLTKAPVYVSAKATGANITFKYKTSMDPGNIIYDWRLEIINANTGALLASVGLPLPNETLQTRTVDLLPYKGNYLLFKFKLGELTVGGVRAVYLDDVVVKVSAPVTNQAFIADPTTPHDFEATISLPPVSLGASPEIPPGVYNVTLTFSTDPPYSAAVESGARGPVKTLTVKVRVIGVEAVQVPAKVTTSGEFDIKLMFKTAAADNLNRTLYFETYNVWVSSTLAPFTLFDRATAAKEFGLWIKWDGDVFRKMSFTLPGKGGSTEVTLRLVTQNAKPGIYNIRFFVTSNITGAGEMPTTTWTFGPPPPGGLTYTGAALDFVVRVGDYSISTDTYTLVVPSTGSVEFDVKVKTYVTSFTLSFLGKAYKIELGELVEVKGVSFEFTPSTLSLDADKEATVKVKVKTELATVGMAFIDIVATDGVTTREIQGIKLVIVAGGGSVQEFKVSKGEVKPLSYGEAIVKKLPTYEFTVENKENKVVKEYKPISISSDNVREVQVISGYSTIPFNAIVLVIATLAAIGIAVFISRRYL
jgi:preprotein translocase subunit SecB